MNQAEYEALAQRSLHPKSVSVYLYLKYQLLLQNEGGNSCEINVLEAIKKTGLDKGHAFMDCVESLENHGLVLWVNPTGGWLITVDFPLVHAGKN